MTSPPSPTEDHHAEPSPLQLQFDPTDANEAVDSALRLIPSPLVPAARAAAQHPFSVDELNQDIEDPLFAPFNIEDILLDTQYVQLNPQPTTPPAPSASQPSLSEQPTPTVTTNPTQTLPTPASSAPQPSATTTRRRPSPRHTRRSAPNTSTPAHIPIAPRSHAPRLSKRSGPQFEHNGPARLVECRSAALPTASSHSLPLHPSHVSYPSTPMVPGMFPLMNMASMYPLQPHTPMFQPQLARKEPSVSVPGNSENKKRRVDNPLPAAAPNQFLPSHVPVVSPAVVPYDPAMMPLIQMTQMQQMYAQLAAAAAAVQGQLPSVVNPGPNPQPSVVQSAPNAQPLATSSFPLGTSLPAHHSGSSPPARTIGGDLAILQSNINVGGEVRDFGASGVSAGGAAGSRPEIAGTVQAGTDVAIGGDARKVVVPQQALARLERHPVLGRLQLQSDVSKGGSGTTLVGKSGVRMTDTQGLQAGKEGEARGSIRRTAAGGSGPGSGRAGSSSQRGSAGQGDGERPKPQKKRLVWTPELHERFVRAIDAVGLNQAVPKTLVTIMNVEGLTTEHVKSHLQKYRNSLRKEAVEDLKERNQAAGATGPGGTSRALGLLGGPIVELGVGHAVVAGEIGSARFGMLPNRINVHGEPVAGLGSGVVGGAAESSTAGHGNPPADQAPADQVGGISVSHGTTVRRETNMTESFEPKIGASLEGALHPGVAAQLVGGGVAGVGPLSVDSGMAGLAENVGVEMQHEGHRSENPTGLGGIVEMSQGTGSGIEKSQNQPDSILDVDGARTGAVKKREGGGPGASSNKIGSEIREITGGSGVSRVGSTGEGSRSTRQDKEAKLELMNEKTLQMQLTLQMMVHRTIALEKRLEQESTDRMQTEASAAASGRSGRSDRGGGGAGGNDATVGLVEDGQAPIGEKGPVRASGDEVDEKGGRCESGGSRKKGKTDGKDTERNDDGMSSKSAIAALLKDQMEMGKVLEQARAMINEQMRGQSGAAEAAIENAERPNLEEQDNGKDEEGNGREDVATEDAGMQMELPGRTEGKGER
eukprot:GFKZ01005430.1.p1 GENE.GFKZ01005430.1~~GFKZ01005430.1.p1  ORF type:complete len:1090 (+),score=176.88 GFKZ01005430.1:138-3272(+)